MHVFFEFIDDLVSPFVTKGIYLINRPKLVYEHAYQIFLDGFFETSQSSFPHSHDSSTLDDSSEH